ncbi:RNA helicase [Geminocystis sp. NIES-3709]|uniref:DEAD/DEAH box helicase n=1 Tax=Geminocystis sp. NIES-3709 TaxID=1617448 RepID=UPI0005FCAFF8|nr:DEAD/DEAH box helicase [Geminocystis sp. NIES-3709]BAQ64306.1 helicase [Geminocystis sp. NIES-3709]
MNLNKLDFNTIFPYKLDDFQQEAINYLEDNKSVVVTAPTGSGKTLIGEYAIYRALNQGKRVFYTTPLKALSNQKFRDFQEKFGQTLLPENNTYGEIGLITGDVLINPSAPVIVMTTEIFRNMLYSTPIGEVGTSVREVQTVILDECHYISDPGRGTVWEESIIYCPSNIQLVALSATIGNPQDLCNWINNVRKAHFQQGIMSECKLVNSDFRPVPLKFYFSHAKGLYGLFNEKTQRLNPQLKPFLATNKRGKFNPKDCPSIKTIVQQLSNNNMLPAIYIIFSRKGCDQAVESLSYFNLVTVEESRKILLYLLYFLMIENLELQSKIIEFAKKEHEIAYEKIISFIANNDRAGEDLVNYLIDKPLFKERLLRFLADNSELVRSSQIEPLTRGIAAHHAGILPAWKELVERLFELGLVKIVFATATLAAGINMPARTTVISALKKRGDDGHRLLTPSEFLQIAGRAGRRGMDKVGYVITVQTLFEGVLIASKMAKASPEPLRSQFTPSYGMVLNLLQKHTIEEAKDLLELSFAEYLAQLQLLPQEDAIASYTTELTKLDIMLAGYNSRDLANYEKLKERKKQEKKILKLFQRNWIQARQRAIMPYLETLLPGAILHLSRENKKNPYNINAVFVAHIPNGNQKFLLCLGKDNNWYIASFVDVIDINGGRIPSSLIEQVDIPDVQDFKIGLWCYGDENTINVSQLISEYEQEYTQPTEEIIQQQQRIAEVEDSIVNNPLDKVEKIGQILKNNRKRQLLKQELTRIQTQYQRGKSNSSYYWQEFLALIEILREFGALDKFTPTPLGEAAAVIRGENELWLGLALMSRRLDFLSPHHLAGVITALITEPARFDTWVGYQASPEVLDTLGLQKIDDINYNPQQELWEIRRRLNQAQKHHEITIPVWLERDMIGLSEAWCLGETWEEIAKNTTMDEGDIVRVLRRTVDVLVQIPQVPGVDNNLIKTAKEAVIKMRRFPVL